MHQRRQSCGVHIERERRRRTALGDFLGGNGIAQEPGLLAAVLFGDDQAVEAGVPEGRIILLGRRAVPVVLGRTGRKVSGELTGNFLETNMIRGQSEFHETLLCRGVRGDGPIQLLVRRARPTDKGSHRGLPLLRPPPASAATSR